MFSSSQTGKVGPIAWHSTSHCSSSERAKEGVSSTLLTGHDAAAA